MAALRVAVSRSAGADACDYVARLAEAGLEAIELWQPAEGLDGSSSGLLVTGGRDIDPGRYGEDRQPETQEPNPERDQLDLQLLRQALAEDLPVLAICRGLQALNVCLGGSLLQHIASGEHEAQRLEPKPSRWHDVEVLPGSRLATVYGHGRMLVNSRHHQAVTPQRLAPGLRAAAMSADGLVEAAESEGHAWVVGVQWHPERPEPEVPAFTAASARLFRAFAEAASAFEAGRRPSPSRLRR